MSCICFFKTFTSPVPWIFQLKQPPAVGVIIDACVSDQKWWIIWPLICSLRSLFTILQQVTARQHFSLTIASLQVMSKWLLHFHPLGFHSIQEAWSQDRLCCYCRMVGILLAQHCRQFWKLIVTWRLVQFGTLACVSLRMLPSSIQCCGPTFPGSVISGLKHSNQDCSHCHKSYKTACQLYKLILHFFSQPFYFLNEVQSSVIRIRVQSNAFTLYF